MNRKLDIKEILNHSHLNSEKSRRALIYEFLKEEMEDDYGMSQNTEVDQKALEEKFRAAMIR